MFDLTGKRALVTGSTQGIGYAIAKILAEFGALVYIHCSCDEKKALSIKNELGCYGAVTCDLSDIDAAEKLFKKTGNVDIVVANASVQTRCPWQNISVDDFDHQVNVNLRSTLALMQTYIPYMQEKKWGRFLTLGSVQQYKPHKDMAIYASTKCAIQSLVENVAKQVAKDSVTVNNLVPGVIITPRNTDALSDESYRDQVLKSIPIGMEGEPDDCAYAALLLCSEEGRYITGAELKVDGGMSL